MKFNICQFAKAPIIGKVKTRLNTEFSKETSLSIHCALVEDTLRRLSIRLTSQTDDVQVTYSLWASDYGVFFDDMVGRYKVDFALQTGKDLGERLANTCQVSLENNDAVILIGSDCPYLDEGHLRQIFACLSRDNVDAALIPAEDGGYVLLALKKYYFSIFQDIEWGSDAVLSQTIEKLDSLRFCYELLPALADIDHPEDFRQLCKVRKEFCRFLD